MRFKEPCGSWLFSDGSICRLFDVAWPTSSSCCSPGDGQEGQQNTKAAGQEGVGSVGDLLELSSVLCVALTASLVSEACLSHGE